MRMYTGPLCAIVVLNSHHAWTLRFEGTIILHAFITKAILAKTIIQNASLIFRLQFFGMVKVDGCLCEKCGAAYNPGQHPECPACAKTQERMDVVLPPWKKKRVQECGIYVEIASFPLPGDPPQPSSAASCHQPRPSSRYQPTPSTAAGSFSARLLERLHRTIVANRRYADQQPVPKSSIVTNHRYANQQHVPKSSVSTAAAPNAVIRFALPFRVPLTKECKTPHCHRRVNLQPDRMGRVHNHCCSLCRQTKSLSPQRRQHSSRCLDRTQFSRDGRTPAHP